MRISLGDIYSCGDVRDIAINSNATQHRSFTCGDNPTDPYLKYPYHNNNNHNNIFTSHPSVEGYADFLLNSKVENNLNKRYYGSDDRQL